MADGIQIVIEGGKKKAVAYAPFGRAGVAGRVPLRPPLNGWRATPIDIGEWQI
jgi:hypothetical protein